MRRSSADVVRVVTTSCVPGRRLLEACATLGLGVRMVGGGDVPGTARCVIDAALRQGTITLLTGPSGSGKSTLLRRVRDALAARGVACEHARVDDDLGGCVLDCVGASGQEAARILAGAGLGDALLWARRPCELSEGERARFAIARAWWLILERGGGVMTADEFASVLDRRSARALCCTLRRMVERDGRVGVVLATGHDDVVRWLRPDVHVECAEGKARLRTGEIGGGDANRRGGGLGTGRRAPALQGGCARDARARDRGVGRSRRSIR